ncbi:MAG: hypothetical protein CVU11_14035 [Bacteroidetes bacterium HGW-Bacteroidetes-6]|jgi:hypothetical protein|nr:MAG: hypothetical protein CVU11_14035 [Bacteroidetes bacterium HGW-Bacteroidetes-6]
MRNLNCPYCGKPQDVNHDDGENYEEDTKHQMECCDCGKSFVFYTTIMYLYEGIKADCLNDGKHDYKPTTTHPVQFTKMECSMCGDQRNPTEAEMLEIMKADERRGK